MASSDERRLAQAMLNSLSALPARDGQVYTLIYKAGGGERSVYNEEQVENTLDARPGLEVLGDADRRGVNTFAITVALTRDLDSLAEAVPVWVIVEGEGSSGEWRLADFRGPMSKGEAGVPPWEVVFPPSVERFLDPLETQVRAGETTVETLTTDPARALKEAPPWVWAVIALGAAATVGPTIVNIIDRVAD